MDMLRHKMINTGSALKACQVESGEEGEEESTWIQFWEGHHGSGPVTFGETCPDQVQGDSLRDAVEEVDLPVTVGDATDNQHCQYVMEWNTRTVSRR